MKKITNITCILLASYLLFSCGETKTIPSGNYIFRYTDNLAVPRTTPDQLTVYRVDTPFKAKIDDKTDFLFLKSDVDFTANLTPVATVNVSPPNTKKIGLNNKFYTSEVDLDNFTTAADGTAFNLDDYNGSFVYYDYKFAIQTLSVPLKFRKSIDGSLSLPNQVETGFNIGLAPVMKWNVNVYNPVKKRMGKITNVYSVNTGALINFGATDLKAASNAPGLNTDRKAATFTYGGVITFGVNNFHIGYAVGADSVIGEGRANWLYQNRLWHGFIIGLDIIKP